MAVSSDMATYSVTERPVVNVRDLIMALRKVANSDAPVFLDCGNGQRFIGQVQITDMMEPMRSMVHIVGGEKLPP